MRRLRRLLLYVAGAIAVAVLLVDIAAAARGWRFGVKRATRHQIDGHDTTTDRGVFFNGSLVIYSERGATSPVAVGVVRGELEFDRWSTTDNYSGFGVTSKVPPTFNISESMLLGTGYRYSRADAPGVWGEHRLVRVSPLAICLACAAVIAMAARSAFVALRTSRRAREGHCRRCGYDLRAGHAQCPECGTPVPSDGARPTTGAVA